MTKIQEFVKIKKDLVGFWGVPEPKIFSDVLLNYTDYELIDLDIDYGAPSSGVLPDAYCKIIKNIIDNSIVLKDKMKVIVASVGEEKCDSGRFAAMILNDMGMNVIQTRFTDYEETEIITPISKSNMPLRAKIEKIMDNVAIPQDFLDIEEVKPEFGFWGVPPNDFSILDLFPQNTHVYGWTRCVEAKRPADYELELFVDEAVPIVFFAQTFCAKMQLAKYLAKKHNGLYVDVDDYASNSVKAKIEAFIKLG